MKKMETSGAGYRLVARMSGQTLTLETRLCDELRGEHLRTIRELSHEQRASDRRAFATSIEWERLGDFLSDVGRKAGAAKAYSEAITSCLDGVYYDYGSEHFPCRGLRMRFYELIARTAVFCGEDVRLKLLCEDSLIGEEYERFSAHDWF